MGQIKITIDGMEIWANAEEKVLAAALRNDIFIPNLCYLSEVDDSFASCRLCFVEVEGVLNPVTSCTEPVREGMIIRTDTEPVKRLQRSALRLLLSAHHIDCKNCYANRHCALQDLGRRLNVRLKTTRLRNLSTVEPLDRSLGTIFHDSSKCVLCGRCVRLRNLKRDTEAFNFSHRGFATRITTYTQVGPPKDPKSYIEICPVGALIPASAVK